MSLFVILLGGDLVATPRLAAQCAGARVIAADSGIRYAGIAGMMPELWVGDFDSATEEDFRQHAAVPRRTFPAAKDNTDGELAVDIAIVDQTTGRTLWERKGLVVTGEYDEDREVEGRRQALEDVVTALVEGAQSQW